MTRTITTEAWVLTRPDPSAPPQLRRQPFSFSDLIEDEVLVEPLFGCWEGNMGHALAGSPMDLFRHRGEAELVLGNAGVVRVLRCGPNAGQLEEGALCLVFCAADVDEHGYPRTIMGYDAPGTMGVLARQAKVRRRQLIAIPPRSQLSLRQWAAFSLRYITAFSNWKSSERVWRVQMEDAFPAACDVVGWGGGVAFAELELARMRGCRSTLISSRAIHRDKARQRGMQCIARPNAPHSEKAFLDSILAATDGRGASIFIDNIGADFRLTLKALARQGVITTCGWREGMVFPLPRAAACMARHTHVFTHYAPHRDAIEAVAFAESTGWAPEVSEHSYDWADIGLLADAYAKGEIEDYFPIFVINR